MFVYHGDPLHPSEASAHRTPWDDVHVPTISPDGWTAGAVEDGLRVLERIRREIESASAALVSSMPDTRDAVAALGRVTGVSAAEARRRRSIAAVVADFPVVAGLLKAGLLSGEHVGALAPIREHADDVRVVALWAVGKPPEDLRAEVERIRLSHLAGSDAYARQRAMRRLVLTTGPDGMVALHGMLPPKEGALLESLLRTVMDANWLHDHPDRAEALGGHAGDTRDQRRLDALLQLLGLMPSPLGHSRDAAADSAGEATHPSAADAGSSPGVASDTDPPGKPRPMQVNTGKPAVVIVFDVDRYEAEILGHGPTPVTPELFDPVKVDLYYFFKNGKGEIPQVRQSETRSNRCATPRHRGPRPRLPLPRLPDSGVTLPSPPPQQMATRLRVHRRRSTRPFLRLPPPTPPPERPQGLPRTRRWRHHQHPCLRRDHRPRLTNGRLGLPSRLTTRQPDPVTTRPTRPPRSTTPAPGIRQRLLDN